MQFKPHKFDEDSEDNGPGESHLPPPIRPGRDPIPFLFWNIMALAAQFEELKKALKPDDADEPRDEQDVVYPLAIRQALGKRCSELPPIPEGAGEKVPWDEFHIWLSHREESD